MNISEYLKNSKGNAWLMNDDCFMVWESCQWAIYSGVSKKHLILATPSLEIAIAKMKEPEVK